jgi:hypothetical protein
MNSMRDEDLMRDPAIRQAVEAQRTAKTVPTRSHHRLIGWLVICAVIGVLLILLISLNRVAG